MINYDASGGIVIDTALALTMDAAGGAPGEQFRRLSGFERRYVRQLREIAAHVGKFITGVGDPLQDPMLVNTITNAMGLYAQALEPWARAWTWRTINQMDQQNEAAWLRNSRLMSQSLRAEIANAPTGEAMRALMDEQVVLIQSLPTEAAQRVHKLTMEGMLQGTRAREISKMIQASGEVCKSRADLIARTEVGRTATNLTQARAQYVGSTEYIWRTSRDERVRHSHAEMEGRTVAWNDPPTLDNLTGHAGALPNCRCYPEPIIPAV